MVRRPLEGDMHVPAEQLSRPSASREKAGECEDRPR